MGQTMIKRNRIFLLAATFAAATATVFAGDSKGIRLYLDPPAFKVALGERRTVELKVAGLPADGISAFQVKILFDPTLVEVLDPNAAYTAQGVEPFMPLGATPQLCTLVRQQPKCPDARWLLTSTGRQAIGMSSVDRSGKLIIAYGTSGGADLPTADGTLAVIHVVGKTHSDAALEIVEKIVADASDPPRNYFEASERPRPEGTRWRRGRE